MKLINKTMLIGAVCLGGLAFTACSDDDTYDVTGSTSEKVFFDPHASAVQQNEIYNTPAGVFGLVGGAFAVNSQYGASGRTITLGAEVDNSLVDAFNAEHGTEDVVYHQVPADALAALQVSDATIEPGSSVGDTTLIVSIPSENCSSLTEEYYVLPLKLKIDNYNKGGSNYDVSVRDTFNTVYAVIHNAGSDFIYTTGNYTQTCAVVTTPVGVFGGVDAEFNVAVRANGNSTFTVKAEIDNSLIDAYNEENGTSYVQVPANIASQFQITDGTIAAGQLTTSPGVKVTDPNEAAKEITESCILPLKMTFVYPNGQTAELPNAYVIIEPKTSFINDDATEIVGTEGDGSAWTAIDCTNLDASGFSSLFSGYYWSRNWAILDTSTPSAQFTVDLGEEKSLTGFYLDSRVMKDFDTEVSTDNATWTSLGNSDGHTAVSNFDYETYTDYNEYVLYGAIKCRYVRFTVNFDTSSWYWTSRWGNYKGISGLSLYFN